MVFLRGIGTVLMGMQNEFYGGRGQVDGCKVQPAKSSQGFLVIQTGRLVEILDFHHALVERGHREREACARYRRGDDTILHPLGDDPVEVLHRV